MAQPCSAQLSRAGWGETHMSRYGVEACVLPAHISHSHSPTIGRSAYGGVPIPAGPGHCDDATGPNPFSGDHVRQTGRRWGESNHLTTLGLEVMMMSREEQDDSTTVVACKAVCSPWQFGVVVGTHDSHWWSVAAKTDGVIRTEESCQGNYGNHG